MREQRFRKTHYLLCITLSWRKERRISADLASCIGKTDKWREKPSVLLSLRAWPMALQYWVCDTMCAKILQIHLLRWKVVWVGKWKKQIWAMNMENNLLITFFIVLYSSSKCQRKKDFLLFLENRIWVGSSWPRLLIQRQQSLVWLFTSSLASNVLKGF